MIIRAQLISCGRTCWQDRKPVAKHQYGQTAYQRCECTSVNLLVWWCSLKRRCTAQLAFCGDSSKIQNIARPLLWGEYSSGLEKHTKWLLEQNDFAKIKVLAQRDSLFPKSTGSAGSLLKLILLTVGACLRGLCRAAARLHPKAGAPAAGLAAGFCAGLAGPGAAAAPLRAPGAGVGAFFTAGAGAGTAGFLASVPGLAAGFCASVGTGAAAYRSHLLSHA